MLAGALHAHGILVSVDVATWSPSECRGGVMCAGATATPTRARHPRPRLAVWDLPRIGATRVDRIMNMETSVGWGQGGGAHTRAKSFAYHRLMPPPPPFSYAVNDTLWQVCRRTRSGDGCFGSRVRVIDSHADSAPPALTFSTSLRRASGSSRATSSSLASKTTRLRCTTRTCACASTRCGRRT